MKVKSTLFFMLSVIFSLPTLACTGMQLKANEGTFINGRTVEFGIPIHAEILIIPHHYQFRGTLPDGFSGFSYKAKYAVLGADMEKQGVVVDGLNEAGLSVGTFYFPDYAEYAKIDQSNKDRALSPLEFPNWLLTQFANIDEVKKGLESESVVIAPTPFKAWGFVPAFHYVIYDKSGKSIVIEPINGNLVVHDNPLGVFTNSPDFKWHMTNLKNYINLSPLNVSKIELGGVILKAFGQGSGLHGLPGDFTPPSRFVRAAIFSATALPKDTANETVLQILHILNQFDIPLGSVRTVENGKIHADYTMYTTVKDPQSLSYYIRSYDNQNISVVNLKAFDLNNKQLKRISLDNKQSVTDLSPTLSN